MLAEEKYEWLTILCALGWFAPQLAFKFGEGKEEKPKAVITAETKAKAVKNLKGEIRVENMKAVMNFLVPFLRF